MNHKTKLLLFVIIGGLLTASEALARGGGGGSGGGGGGGGGFGGSYSGGSGGGSPWWLNLGFIIIFLVIAAMSVYAKNKYLKQRDAKESQLLEAEHIEAAAIKQRATDVFYKFEEAWSNFDLPAMKNLLSDTYYRRMELELAVLQAEHRQDNMFETKLDSATISDVLDFDGRPGVDEVVVRIAARAQDELRDTQNDRRLFLDVRPFVEYWHFIKQNEQWVLHLIKQETENASLVETEISAFAGKNGFFYDADFGWLMMPNKGVLFKQTNFGRSDINNHVIGSYRGKIVEFYTYIPNTQAGVGYKNYLIAQAILPINYKNILIKKKRWLNFGPWGLKRQQLESADFNAKFCLWADPQDQINSLELLTPNFMEKIYNLPFELNIEIVGGFLYFYTKDRGAANYDQMLQILSWAFDEMKM
ncbi:MAG: DUF3137 domain-containing protein [Patescibacteria group bacterium]|nr:DUF3137 domain-containing protein [Patescibacteria group bacterium]